MKPHVLVVDDSLTVRMDLRTMLGAAGFWVKTCDVLPDGSGADLLKQIKESPELRSIRVIMLASEAEVRMRTRGLRLGAEHYVSKPFNREYLARIARKLFNLADARRIATAPRHTNTKRLLLVDDSPTFIYALAMALRQDGYEVVMAYSGEDAVALLAGESFAAVLIDMMMPGISGVETCRRLRAISRLDQSIIVLMTTSETLDWRQAALDAGADGLIVKPRNLSLVTALLLGLFVRKRQQLSASRALLSV